MKKVVALCIFLALALTLFGCAGTSGPEGGTFTIEEIQGEPDRYLGTITLTGITGPSPRHNFALQNEAGTFEVQVDYRGSQALPQIGDRISVEGQLTQNRPCCGPGFTLTATRFERAE